MLLKNILLYQVADEKVNISVYCKDGTFWFIQKAMAALFGVNVPAVSKHLKKIFKTSELEEDSVISILETTAHDGKNYNTKFYRLEAILAVGYRVNSAQATDFRKRGLAFNIQQWTDFLNKFLELSNYPILIDKSKVSMVEAKIKAETEYDKYRIV